MPYYTPPQQYDNYPGAIIQPPNWAALAAVKYGAPQIHEGGSIVLTTGIAGQRPRKGWVIAASVCGTIEALVRALAIELAPIRVNAVSPGIVRTNLWQSMSAPEREHLYESVGQSLPVGRVGEASDIAQAYLFLIQEGFATGDGQHTYQLANAPPVTPLICYEIIFPAAVTPSERPGWFVNVTDDSWFGPWAGPYQHLLIARARAIEEALPVARAANTGISAVIDPMGRIVARLDLGVEGVLDSGLPSAVPPTIYARHGDLPAALLVIAALILVVRRRVMRRVS